MSVAVIPKIDYASLISQERDLSSSIHNGFGMQGGGVLIIKNIPNYSELRSRVLYNGYLLSQQPRAVKDSLTVPESNNLIGWTEAQFTELESGKNLSYSSFTTSPLQEILNSRSYSGLETFENVWPDTIPDFRSDSLQLSEIILKVLENLYRQIVKYLANSHQFCEGINLEALQNNYNYENRLVVYDPPNPYLKTIQNQPLIWDFMHIDFGLLTALTHPIYFSESGESNLLNHTCLIVKDRQGNDYEVEVGINELILLPSASLCLLSGGVIPATPHMVIVNPNLPLNLYRITLGSFFDPPANFRMNLPTTIEEIKKKDPYQFRYMVGEYRQGITYAELFKNPYGEEIKKNGSTELSV